ncbi:MAG: metallophosphoesterase family protein [Pseudomonadota bacterium]
MTPVTAIVGDVHGMLAPLQALLERLALGESDHLVFVGDLVDKGPDPAGVVRYLRRLNETAPFAVTLVEGNHEDRHRRYFINKTRRPAVAFTMASAAWDLPALDLQLSSADRDFLAEAVPFLRVPDWNILVVHGGIPGNMEQFPDTLDEATALRGKARGFFRQVLRTRYIASETGKFRAYGAELPGDPFWAERYDGRFGHVVFGHQPFIEGPACYPHATGIDTAAVHGGHLTALVLPMAGPARFETVPAAEHRTYRHGRQPTHPGNRLSLVRQP